MQKATHVVTGEVRLSYVSILKPKLNEASGKEKYSATVLLPKSDAATKQKLDQAIAAAKQDGGVRLWGGVPPVVNIPIHDGDGARPSDGMPFGPECKGHWVFTASCNPDRPPRIVDAQLQDIIDPREIYSGMYARVGLDLFPYFQAGKKGIGIGLGNVQKLRDGEPLAGGASVDEDFGGTNAVPASQAQPAQSSQSAYNSFLGI